jgi:hypothetical protein
MESRLPGVLPWGSALQAGPKTSALVVTPVEALLAAGADAEVVGAGALVAGVLADVPLLHAARVSAAAAVRPIPARRRVFTTSSNSSHFVFSAMIRCGIQDGLVSEVVFFLLSGGAERGGVPAGCAIGDGAGAVGGLRVAGFVGGTAGNLMSA